MPASSPSEVAGPPTLERGFPSARQAHSGKIRAPRIGCRRAASSSRPLWFAVPTALLVLGAVVLRFGIPSYKLGGQMTTRTPRLRTLIFLTAATIVAGVGERYGMPRYREYLAIQELKNRAVGVDVEPDVPKSLEWLFNLAGPDLSALFGHASLAFVDVNNEFDDRDAVHLRELQQLKFLSLGHSSITDAGLEQFSGLRRLKKLVLAETRISGSGLKSLQGLPTLEILNLKGTQIGNDGLRLLGGLPPLRALNLDETAVTDEGLEHLKRLPNLSHLDLTETGVSDDGMRHLGDVTTLENLRLTRTKISDAGIEHLSHLENLQCLWLNWTDVSDGCVPRLKRLKRLRGLRAGGTRISAAGVMELQRAIPGLTVTR